MSINIHENLHANHKGHSHSVIAQNTKIDKNVKVASFCVIGENVEIAEGTSLGVGCVLADNVKIGSNVQLGNYVTLADNVVLEPYVTIEDHTTVYPSVIVGEGTFIGSNASIGRPPRAASTSTVKKQSDLPQLTIGRDSIIGCSAVIYTGTYLAENVFVGDRALIRERCTIGKKAVIGSGCAVENDTKIGEFTKIQTGSYITAYMEIEDHVFIAPMVTTTNDNYMGRTEKRFQHIRGATIRKGARVGGGAILLPGIEVSEETFVAAGSLVSKNTPSHKVIKGFPAKEVRDVPEEEHLDNNFK